MTRRAPWWLVAIALALQATALVLGLLIVLQLLGVVW
jgi:hypothetical protein